MSIRTNPIRIPFNIPNIVTGGPGTLRQWYWRQLIAESYPISSQHVYSQGKGFTSIQKSIITFSEGGIQGGHLPKRSSLNSCFILSKFETFTFERGRSILSMTRENGRRESLEMSSSALVSRFD
jgi:hypothetical protein